MNVDKIQKLKSLINNLATRFNDANTTKNEKFQILTLIPSNWTATDIKKYFQVSDYMITLSRKLQKEKGLMTTPELKKGL